MISIIDDDESVRESTKGLVRSLGYDAIAYRSAEDFLLSDEAQETACIISDIQMPGLGGLDLQDKLMAQGRKTPMIFITAFPDERCRMRALSAGAFGYLPKPFDDEILISCLDKALSG